MEVRYYPFRKKPFKFNRVWNTRDELREMGMDWVCHNAVLNYYGGRDKVIDKINEELHILSRKYAEYNAHGFPITAEGTLTLEHGIYLKFKERILLTSEQFPAVLKELSTILEKYY